jgi:hypothetical protein
MDPEQVRSEMRATRRRIDEKLDLLQARMQEQRGAVTRTALGGGALLSLFYMWSKLRARNRRKRARAHVLARAQSW